MEKEVTLIIEDGDMAIWGPINNTYAVSADGWRRTEKHWNGLLIRLGRYKEFLPDDPGSKQAEGNALRNAFGSVQFRDAAGGLTRTCVFDRFSWINLYADLHGRISPSRGRHGDKAHLDRLLNRDSFKPFASITYWHDWDGYDIATREHFIGGRLSLRYTFTFHQVACVDVFNGNEHEDVDLSEVSTILVHALRRSKGPQGGTNDPPPKQP